MGNVLVWIIGAVLLIIIAVLLLRIRIYQKQIRSFTKQMHDMRTERQDGLVNVDTFGKDYVELANELQRYVDEEQKLLDKSEMDRQSVKNMVAGISHDFRTPLTTAMGYIQLVQKDETLSQENAENLGKAYDKTKYLKELSDEFFALSVMENRKAEELEEISFKKLFENVTLEQYEWTQKAGVAFSADVTEDPCMITASEVDMTRLLMNLYSNARKYAKSSISVALRKEDKGFVFSIENDYPDEIEMDVRRVFEPFHREYVGEQGGNGLGLYVTKRIVENYCGTITADKTDATFSIQVMVPDSTGKGV